MPWWSSHTAYSRPNVILFQVDLAGHSAWIEQLPTDLETAQARADFSVRLKHALSVTGFDRLNWLGDGGLFVRKCDDHGDAERVCTAADNAFRVFREWRRPDWNLHLRVSATFATSVFIHPEEPGEWCSPRLNAFLKFERDIGLRNTFVITDELRRYFSGDGQCIKRFNISRRINLGGSEQITVWLDDFYPLEVQPDPVRFPAWLQSKASKSPFAHWQTSTRPAPSQALWFGDSCIFNAALEAGGYQAIELTLTDFPGVEAVLRAQDASDWTLFRERNREHHIIGTKLSLVQIRGELKDDPIVRLQYRLSAYEDIKAFEALVENDSGRLDYYLPLLLRVLRDGTSLPTTLSNHVVLVVGKPALGQSVVIAHRRKGRRPGSFSDNCWSVSFEEQFNPIKGRIGRKETAADRTIAECALRGLREEFIGDNYAGATHVSVHAFIIEGSILNFAVLTLLELPDATVEDIQRWWLTPGVAVDAEEHDAISGIPLESNSLIECLASDNLPECFRGYSAREIEFSDADHRWHPTAPLRLALAAWFAERRTRT